MHQNNIFNDNVPPLTDREIIAEIFSNTEGHISGFSLPYDSDSIPAQPCNEIELDDDFNPLFSTMPVHKSVYDREFMDLNDAFNENDGYAGLEPLIKMGDIWEINRAEIVYGPLPEQYKVMIVLSDTVGGVLSNDNVVVAMVHDDLKQNYTLIEREGKSIIKYIDATQEHVMSEVSMYKTVMDDGKTIHTFPGDEHMLVGIEMISDGGNCGVELPSFKVLNLNTYHMNTYQNLSVSLKNK